MNDHDLDSLLKQAKTPEPPQEFWDDLPGRIVRRLDRPEAPSPSGTRWRPWLAWGSAVAAVCLAVSLGVGRRHGRTETASFDPLLQNAEVIREVMVMFPNRVRAIVEDERGLRLELAEREEVPESTPLFLEICEGKKCSTVVTFSGQAVRIAGREVTVLSDARGGVIVMGKGFLWTTTNPGRAADGLRIQARELGRAVAG